MSDGKLIHEAMADVMAELSPVGKDGTHAQGWKFRSIYGVYKAIQPLLAKHGITMRLVSCEELHREHGQGRSGAQTTTCVLKCTYAFAARDGSEMTTTVTNEAFDVQDKAYNKALSFCHKYAIVQTFCIPDQELDEGEANNITVTRTQMQPAQQPKISMVDAFAKVGVNIQKLSRFGTDLDAGTRVQQLREIYRQITSGADPKHFFPDEPLTTSLAPELNAMF